MLGLVVCALVVSGALPLREYLSQRGAIADAVAAQAAQRGRVASLEQQQGQLQDPAYVRSQARLRLHYVLPGETAYVVLGPAGTSGPSGPKGRRQPAKGSAAPWYSQLWGSVQAADRPGR